MLPDRFANAWLNGRHRVLGRRLRPYCLWHRFALEAIDSPFLQRGGKPTIGDLEIAVRICCSRYPVGDSASFARLLTRKLPWWRRWQLRWIAARHNLAAEGEKFVAYVCEFQQPPDLWQRTGMAAQETSGAPPETLSVAAQLMRGNFSEVRAWMMPIGRSYWWAATFARLDGHRIEFLNESPELFAGLQRLKDMVQTGELRFASEGVYYTPKANG